MYTPFIPGSNIPDYYVYLIINLKKCIPGGILFG